MLFFEGSVKCGSDNTYADVCVHRNTRMNCLQLIINSQVFGIESIHCEVSSLVYVIQVHVTITTQVRIISIYMKGGGSESRIIDVYE